MKSGQLNAVIEIYEQTALEDVHGGFYPELSLYWKTHAKIEPLKASRGLESAQTELRQGFNISVRWRSDKSISKTMLIKYRSKWLAVQSEQTIDENKRELYLVGMDSGKTYTITSTIPTEKSGLTLDTYTLTLDGYTLVL